MLKKMRKLRERVLSIVLTLVLVMSNFAGGVEVAHASDNSLYEPLLLNSSTLNGSTVKGLGDSDFVMDLDGGFFSSAVTTDGAFPDDGKITTSDGVPYQLAWTGSDPYAGNDSIRFQGTKSGGYVTSDSVTMKVNTYGVYDKVYVLGTAGGFADNTQSLNFKVRLTYTDNTYTETTYNLYDWYKSASILNSYGVGYKVFKRLNSDGVSIDSDFGTNGGPVVQSKKIECDETKVLKDITFQIADTPSYVANDHGIYAAIYAVTGMLKDGAPSYPTPAVQSVGRDNITLEWDTVEGADRYVVEVSSYPTFQDERGEASFVSGYINKMVYGTSTVIEGLDFEETYYCRVRAVAADGAQSRNSVTVSATTAEPSGGNTSIYNIIDKVDISVNPDFMNGLASGTYSKGAAEPFILGDSSNGIYGFSDYYDPDLDARVTDVKLYCGTSEVYDGDSIDLANNTYHVETTLEITDQESMNRFGTLVTALSGDENFTFNQLAASSLDEEVRYNFFIVARYTIAPGSVTPEPTYPLGTIVNLGDDSITIDENNFIHYDIPEDRGDYIYITEVFPTSYLGEIMSATDYVAMLEKGVGKSVVDVVNTLDMENAEYNMQFMNDEMTIFILSGEAWEDEPAVSYEALTEEAVVTIYKFHKDNFIYAEYDRSSENPYFQNLTGQAYLYAVYGVHAEIITPEGIEAEETYELTLDNTNYSGEWLELYVYDKDNNYVGNVSGNGDVVEMPKSGFARVFADSEFTVEAEGATISEMLSAGEEGIYYEITDFAGDTTVVINPEEVEVEETYELTLDSTNYSGEWLELYVYDKDNNYVGNVSGNGDVVEMPKSGFARVFADSEFTVEAEGATISEMLSAGEEGIYYEITDFAGDTTVVINPDEDPEVDPDEDPEVDPDEDPEVDPDENPEVDPDEDPEVDPDEDPEVVTPVITGQPKNTSVKVGERATFAVTATGDDLSYQWMINRNDGNGFVKINGATSATYTTSVVDIDCDGFAYKCVITNEAGTVTTATVTLTVTEKEVVHTHALTKVPATAATCTEAGNEVYYTCSGCDVLFADADATTTTTLEKVKIAALGHDMSKATCTENATCKRTGCDHTEDALGHDWSGKWTVIKEAIATEEGKKETFCTRECGQKKVVIIPKVGEVDDKENLEKDAEVAVDAPIKEVTLNNSKDELLKADNIFTEKEKEKIANGEDARVWIEITKTDESKIAAKDKAKIEKEAAKIMGANPKVMYFDADLFKQVGTDKKQEVTEPGMKMKITIVIPDELLNSDKSMMREYKIIRLHEGKNGNEVDVISGVFNPETNEFIFETDRFSTYAIAYGDTPVDDKEVDDDKTPTTDKKDEVPKTGENNLSSYAMVLMLVSGLGIYFCAGKRTVIKKR